MEVLVCPVCDDEFNVKPSKVGVRTTCSNECRDKYRGREKEIYHLDSREQSALGHGVCPICGDTFDSAHAVKSHAPAKHGFKITHEKHTCDTCGEEFTRVGWQNSDSDGDYCSKACAIEKTMVSRTGEEHPMYGRRGPDSPAFIHGFHGLNVTDRLRRAYDGHWQTLSEKHRKQADGCEMCGEDGLLHTHHIVPLSAGGTNGEYNLMALCGSCHQKVEAFTAKLVDFPVLPEDCNYDEWK